MWGRQLGLVAVLAVHAVSGPLAQQKPLALFAHVVDKDGVPVERLPADAVRVLEDGKPATILSVEAIDWPVKIWLLVDNGPMISDSLAMVRSGVKALVRALPPGVEISLQTIAPQPRWLVRATTDKNALLSGADLIAPDGESTRFVDALRETAVNIAVNKEKRIFPVVIVVGTTGPEGSDFHDNDIQQMILDYRKAAATVHVVLFNRSQSFYEDFSAGTVGAYQTELSLILTRLTGGRYDTVKIENRIPSLLAEIGRQVTTSQARQSRQHRIMFERPDGRTGPVGIVSLVWPSEWKAQLSPDGHMP